MAINSSDVYEDYLDGSAEYFDWQEWEEPCPECDGTGTVPLGNGADLEMDCSACGGLGYE